ncbi:hypothetical protein N7540_010251 [Penicillium herquei]|nr:hypothetical protein N7540_010251 [Penicillium herquei]
MTTIDLTDVDTGEERSQSFFFGTQENTTQWSEKDAWDLSWQPNWDSKSALLNSNITLDCTSAPVKIDPKRTVLVIVDMQNTFLNDEFRPWYKMSKW